MSNNEILPRSKQFEFHTARNPKQVSKKLTKIYKNRKSFADIDLELDRPTELHDYATFLARASDEDPEQAYHVAYQGLSFALTVAGILYPENERPKLEFDKDTTDMPTQQLKEFIEEINHDYMCDRPALDNLIDDHIRRIDPSRNHAFFGSTVAGFAIKTIEDARRRDYIDQIDQQFKEITGNYELQNSDHEPDSEYDKNQ